MTDERPAAGEAYVPAAGRQVLTPLYDAAVRLTMRERRFRGMLVTQALEGLDPHGELLDLGTGTGSVALALAARTTARVTGVDGDERVLSIARRKDSEQRVTWLHASATELPLPAGRVDRVSASLLLHHLSDDAKRRALTEARRVLRPGGRLHIADWARPRGLIPRAGFALLRQLDGRPNTRLHAQGQLPALVASTGFEAIARTARLSTTWGTLELLQAIAPDPSQP